MARIRRVRRSGEPGFSTRSVEGFTGDRVSADRATKSGVRRLFARDPAKHQADPLDFTNDPDVPNPNAAPNPRVVNATARARSSVVNGIQRVRNRSTNRSIKRS